MNVVAYVPDLMDRSKVAAAASGVVFVSSPAALADHADADLVVVDLSRPGVVDALPAGPRLIGFASHVDTDLLARAKAAGCDAMPRSKFFGNVGTLLGA